jgi:Na+/H+ antiporter NhaC
MNILQHQKMIIAGGLSFLIGAFAFVFVFSYLAATFDYPDILSGSAAEVLPRLSAGGSTMLWMIALGAGLIWYTRRASR